MPGILGVAAAGDPASTGARFDAAASRMQRHRGMSLQSFASADGLCRLGHVFRAAAPPGPMAASVVFHGVLHNADDLRSRFAPGTPAGVESLLIALFERFGAGFVEHLEGEFALALWEASTRRVLVATDPVANYAIRWRRDADGLIFGSDLSALLRAAPAARRLNLRAVADYLTIGAVFGDKTLVQDVGELPPGTILTYDVTTDTVATQQYARLDTLFQSSATRQDEYFAAVGEAFKRAVARAASGPGQTGLSLSGGLDSRAILSALSGRSRGLKTYTLGVRGCADEAIAERLSKLSGTRHVFFELNDSYLRDFLANMAEMVSITDGAYLSHGLTEMLAIGFLDETGIDVLLRGHGGELAKAHLAWPLHTDPRVYTLRTLGELVPYLSARANYITPGLSLESILTPAAARAAGTGSLDSFAESLEGTALTPAEACSYLYLRELNRRFTVPSLELFRTRTDVRLPFLDLGVLRALLAAPSSWRDSTAIHQHLTAAGDRRLLKVRNSNTGAPADAGPMTEFVLDKFNTLLKRANAPGYRHYHNFDAWMRRMLLDTVQAELLSPDARVQSFVSAERLSALIEETRRGQADRSYLLQVLLILELWQRENQIEASI